MVTSHTCPNSQGRPRLPHTPCAVFARLKVAMSRASSRTVDDLRPPFILPRFDMTAQRFILYLVAGVLGLGLMAVLPIPIQWTSFTETAHVRRSGAPGHSLSYPAVQHLQHFWTTSVLVGIVPTRLDGRADLAQTRTTTLLLFNTTNPSGQLSFPCPRPSPLRFRLLAVSLLTGQTGPPKQNRKVQRTSKWRPLTPSIDVSPTSREVRSTSFWRLLAYYFLFALAPRLGARRPRASPQTFCYNLARRDLSIGKLWAPESQTAGVKIWPIWNRNNLKGKV